MASSVDSQVFDRVREGDLEALCSMLARVEPLVERHLEARIPRRHASSFDVRDAVQITFTQAIIDFRRFEWKGERAFVAWILKLGTNQLLNAIRDLEARKRSPGGGRVLGSADIPFLEELGMSMSTPSRTVSAAEAREALRSALDDLPPDYAEAVRLYHLQSLTAKETASRMRRSEGSVYMLLQRARETLHDLLGTESRYFT